MTLEILPFDPEYANSFRDLNKAWLEKYFYIEPTDIILLEDCKKSIIDQGGYIFFAKYENTIMGCFSLIRLTDAIYELGKMAVDEKVQGLRIGQKLLTHAVAFGRKKQWDKIILYSSTKLPIALHIYRKYGFREVVLEDSNPYNRSDIKMELDFNTYLNNIP